MKTTKQRRRVKPHSVGPVVRLPSSSFTHENAAELCRVFLWKNIDEPPFMRPVDGWRIVGYGKAPWPGTTNGFAIMLEKMTPPAGEGFYGIDGEEYPLGVRIWQHGREEWVPGLPGYEGRFAQGESPN